MYIEDIIQSDLGEDERINVGRKGINRRRFARKWYSLFLEI